MPLPWRQIWKKHCTDENTNAPPQASVQDQCSFWFRRGVTLDDVCLTIDTCAAKIPRGALDSTCNRAPSLPLDIECFTRHLRLSRNSLWPFCVKMIWKGFPGSLAACSGTLDNCALQYREGRDFFSRCPSISFSGHSCYVLQQVQLDGTGQWCLPDLHSARWLRALWVLPNSRALTTSPGKAGWCRMASESLLSRWHFFIVSNNRHYNTFLFFQ